MAGLGAQSMFLGVPPKDKSSAGLPLPGIKQSTDSVLLSLLLSLLLLLLHSSMEVNQMGTRQSMQCFCWDAETLMRHRMAKLGQSRFRPE